MNLKSTDYYLKAIAEMTEKNIQKENAFISKLNKLFNKNKNKIFNQRTLARTSSTMMRILNSFRKNSRASPEIFEQKEIVEESKEKVFPTERDNLVFIFE